MSCPPPTSRSTGPGTAPAGSRRPGTSDRAASGARIGGTASPENPPVPRLPAGEAGTIVVIHDQVHLGVVAGGGSGDALDVGRPLRGQAVQLVECRHPLSDAILTDP